MAGALDFLTVQGPRPASYTPPTVSSDWIGNLPEDFQKGQQYGRLRNLQTMFQPGTPGAAALQQAGVAPGSLSGLLIGAGGAEMAAPFAQRQLQGQIYQQLMGGGGGPPAGDQQSALPTGGADPRGMMPTVLDAAKINNIDPRRFTAVAHGEGLANYNGDYENGKPTSFGAMQLHFGGRTKGLGDDYFAETHKDPRDPKNEKDMIYFAGRKIREGGWGPWTAARKLGFGKWDGIGQQTAAANPGQSDQLNPTDRASVDAMYPPGGQQPTAAVGTAPVGAPAAPATPAVEQPPGATGQHPYIPQGNAAAPASITGGAAQAKQPPQQVAQAAPPTGAPVSNDVLTRYTQAADNLEKQAAATREQVRRQGLAAAGSGMTIPPESMKAQLDQADKQDAKAAEYRKIVNDQSQRQLETGELQTRGEQAAKTETAKKEQQDQLEYLRSSDREGIEATSHIGQLDTIAELAKKAPYGALTGVKKFLGDYGIPTEGLTDIQAYEDAINFMAPQLRPPGSGPLKNTEIEGFRRSLGGLLTTPEGRILAVNNLKLMSQYKQGLGTIARNSDLTPSQRTQKMAELPFPKLQTALPEQSQKQTTQEEWAKLPRGSHYLAPDGQTRVKQ